MLKEINFINSFPLHHPLKKTGIYLYFEKKVSLTIPIFKSKYEGEKKNQTAVLPFVHSKRNIFLQSLTDWDSESLLFHRKKRKKYKTYCQ